MVFREDNKLNYTKISNKLLKDKQLSLAAKGLLITMLSLFHLKSNIIVGYFY